MQRKSRCKPQRKTLPVNERILAALSLHTKALRHLDKIGHYIMGKIEDLNAKLDVAATEAQETQDAVNTAITKLDEQKAAIADLRRQLEEGGGSQEALDAAIAKVDALKVASDNVQETLRNAATDPPPVEPPVEPSA